jgi:hypothetical protein
MKDNFLISSVLGFDLKADIKDNEGISISSGIKLTIYPLEQLRIPSASIKDKRFFTNFNEDLFNKIINHRKLTT